MNIRKHNYTNWFVRNLAAVISLTSVLLIPLTSNAQGIPFIRNFASDEYHANSTNFDIETDGSGNVFVANFEGLLYYDFAEWRIIHTPGITRTTVAFKASDNNIWVGGYNYFGKIVRKPNGEITLKRICSEKLFKGEVTEIYEEEGELKFIVNNGNIYKVKDDQVSIVKEIDKESLRIGMLDVVDLDALSRGDEDVVKHDTIIKKELGNGITVYVMKNSGLLVKDEKRNSTYTITDANGLCSNNITYAAYDGRGHFWGSTNKGLFVVQLPSALTHFTSNEGLNGTVLTIRELNGKIYAGTDDGLYRQEGYKFVLVPGMPHACWNLHKRGNALLAATADGIFKINADGSTRQLTKANSMAVLDDGDVIYSGEINGIYSVQADGQNRKKICNLENTRKIVKDKSGTIWAQGLYGSVWFKKAGDTRFQLYKAREKSETMLSVVMTESKAVIVSEIAQKPFPYPLESFTDSKGVTWLTDKEGKNLYRWKDGKRLSDMDKFLMPLKDVTIHSIFTRGNELWLGNDDGLFVIDTDITDPQLTSTPKMFIRSVTLGSDSILWGGFGEMPEKLPDLSYNDKGLTFTFSTDYPSIAGETMYRYRLNNGSWSAWSSSTSASFANLSYGDYTFSVQALDITNQETETASIKFKVNPPFYYRWYMIILYFLLMILLAYGIFRLRLRRLKMDKIRLENLVKERTSEVVRLEKMATAGKLTQGLIDRILNPLNYINNFSKLSEGLIKDVKANIEDEKEHMNEDNYEDTVDVLDMLTGNLQKVSEHGQNTTRTLKAMEEMLKDRSGGIVPMDLTAVIHQNEEMLNGYYKKEIAENNIKTVFDLPEQHLQIEGNAEQLSKVIMSMLSNSVYALVKKAQKTSFTPEISLKATKTDKAVVITVHDNGIGIEDTIIEKLFDPFFTTKTTSEAAGVGLYLSREIVQNHGGDITVKSVKDEYSEFTITLPYKK
jgi:signal transduction histidine kinase/ligand-binding sensor domain-containing protein